ncbi:MAG: EAL domain-containing protein [Gammaproteobacteria bacterium]|nr:EAL domain-containing protein [Gammaproteobacteria bacterium]
MTLELPAEKLHDTGAAGDASADSTGNDIDIMQAFGDNRMIQYYQPVMPLSDTATESGKEFYSIRVRMVDTNGEIVPAEQIVNDLKNARNQKLLDRWMLRQTVSRIVSFSQNNRQIPEFIIKLSEESFADANLFQWLQNKLLKQLGKLEPGKSIIIEVTAETYLARERQVEALFRFLRQSYGFRFTLSSFNDIEQLNSCIDKGKFNIYKISQKLLTEIQSGQSDPTAIPDQISPPETKGCARCRHLYRGCRHVDPGHQLRC